MIEMSGNEGYGAQFQSGCVRTLCTPSPPVNDAYNSNAVIEQCQ